MGYFKNEKHDNFKADFGFNSPHKSRKICENPAFANNKLHRIAIMKDEHAGSIGDRDEGGIPGWIVKFVCTGCDQVFGRGAFIVDKK